MARALHYAARDGDLARLRAVLATGVDVDARDGYGNTALHCAANNGRLTCLKALLAAGASVYSASHGGRFTPLHYASQHGHAACIRALIAADSDVNRADRDGRTPFSGALRNGHRRILKILLRAGADVRTQGISRDERNTSTWALVDAIRAAGGWPQYVTLNPPTTFASVVDKATHGALPDPIPLIVATFLVPAGGF